MTSLHSVSWWAEALKHVSWVIRMPGSTGSLAMIKGASQKHGSWGDGWGGGLAYQSSGFDSSRAAHAAFSAPSAWSRGPGNLQGVGTEDQPQAPQLQILFS